MYDADAVDNMGLIYYIRLIKNEFGSWRDNFKLIGTLNVFAPLWRLVTEKTQAFIIHSEK